MNVITHRLVADLMVPRPVVFWTDLVASATIGWVAFATALFAAPFSTTMLAASAIAALALYRGLCFVHELTHLRRGSIPGFETAWNLLLGVPCLLPSFTYIGVHQSHHNLATYGTRDDPEYLPFASSRRLIWAFAVQSALMIPLLLLVRFLLLAPVGLVWRRFHQWLESHASSFCMNPAYRRSVSASMANRIRRWEIAVLAGWVALLASIGRGLLPSRTLGLWYGVLAIVTLLNTLRVLGAHEYQSNGTPRDREGQLSDSIDTPGGPWTEIWAPVGLRYHALHHYFPGIPYHRLGTAYRRIVRALPEDSTYLSSTSPSLRRSLAELYARANQGQSVPDWSRRARAS